MPRRSRDPWTLASLRLNASKNRLLLMNPSFRSITNGETAASLARFLSHPLRSYRDARKITTRCERSCARSFLWWAWKSTLVVLSLSDAPLKRWPVSNGCYPGCSGSAWRRYRSLSPHRYATIRRFPRYRRSRWNWDKICDLSRDDAGETAQCLIFSLQFHSRWTSNIV